MYIIYIHARISEILVNIMINSGAGFTHLSWIFGYPMFRRIQDSSHIQLDPTEGLGCTCKWYHIEMVRIADK